MFHPELFGRHDNEDAVAQYAGEAWNQVRVRVRVRGVLARVWLQLGLD